MIQITLITRSPLHLAGTFSVSPLGGTLPTIPGRSLRGALAELHSLHDDDFAARFLDPRNWFGTLLPLGSEFGLVQRAHILPVTARTCKLHKGFKNRDGHGVRDALFELLMEDPDPAIESCPDEECSAKLVPYSGFYGEDNMGIKRIEPDKRFITKTAIDSRRETAATAQLFSREVIGEGYRFTGFVSIADSTQEAALATMLTNNRHFWLGGGRSRGFGQMEVVDVTINDVNEWLPSHDELPIKIKTFSDKAKAAGVPYSGHTIFAITLRSDAILTDPYLRPATSLVPEYLGRFVDHRLATAVPLGSFVETRTIDGWNAAHRMPRDSMPALAAGSTFAFGIDLPPEELVPLLAPIESVGIGESRVEGFGRAIIDHPFHLQEDMI